MTLDFKRIGYGSMNARQKEAFNFQKVSAVLADYGFTTIRLSNDWCGADFIAQHFDGVSFLKIQLKSRFMFAKKYLGRDLWMCFPSDDQWFLYPHDELLLRTHTETGLQDTASWSESGAYSFPRLPPKLRSLLEPYRLQGSAAGVTIDELGTTPGSVPVSASGAGPQNTGH
jgi:hypothetical protein